MQRGMQRMARSINLSLTDELRAFLDQNSGDGTLFSTPSEFVRALIREKKDRQDAAAIRQSVLEGYTDVRDGRTREFTGDLRSMLDTFRAERNGS
jgi:antitoxin ParD1/3/4